MGTKLEAGGDVVRYLKTQHQQIKSLFDVVLAASGDERRSAFFEIRRLLAVHEAAEEQVVHPVAKRKLANGDAIIEARLKEEAEATKVLAKLEKLDVDSDEFSATFATLKESVIAHAEAEENQEFNALEYELEPNRLQRMRQAAELVEAFAPTRPHPGVGPDAMKIVGPFASMIDRARDAITGPRR